MSEFLSYKNRPLVRKDNTIYYGNMSDKYVIQLTIKDFDKNKDFTTAKNILVQLLDTDVSLEPTKRIVKKSEKQSLYDAMDIGDVWLNRFLKED